MNIIMSRLGRAWFAQTCEYDAVVNVFERRDFFLWVIAWQARALFAFCADNVMMMFLFGMQFIMLFTM